MKKLMVLMLVMAACKSGKSPGATAADAAAAPAARLVSDEEIAALVAERRAIPAKQPCSEALAALLGERTQACRDAVTAARDKLRDGLNACGATEVKCAEGLDTVRAACAGLPDLVAKAAAAEGNCSPLHAGSQGELPDTMPTAGLVMALSVLARDAAVAGKAGDGLDIVMSGIDMLEDMKRGTPTILGWMIAASGQSELALAGRAIMAKGGATAAELDEAGAALDAIIEGRAPFETAMRGEDLFASGDAALALESKEPVDDAARSGLPIDARQALALHWLAGRERLAENLKACPPTATWVACIDGLEVVPRMEGNLTMPSGTPEQQRANIMGQMKERYGAHFAKYARRAAWTAAALQGFRAELAQRAAMAKNGGKCPADVPVLLGEKIIGEPLAQEGTELRAPPWAEEGAPRVQAGQPVAKLPCGP